MQRKKVTVPVPAGVEDNQTMRMAVGKRELFITFRVEKSNYFRRDGADVHTDAAISLSQALLGGTIRVQGVYDDQMIQIMPGTSSHHRIQLSGKGLKRVNSYGQGHHYVNIKIQVPKKLTAKQKALVQAYAELEEDTPGQILGVVHKTDGKSTNFEKAATNEPLSEKFTQKANDEPAYKRHETEGTHEYARNNTSYKSFFFLGFASILVLWLCVSLNDPQKVYEMHAPPEQVRQRQEQQQEKRKLVYDDTDMKGGGK